MVVEFLLPATLVLVVDQLSKSLVTSLIKKHQPFFIGSQIKIRPVKNAGSVLGLGQNRIWLLLLWGLAVISIIILLWHGQFFQSILAQIGLAVALGGATGNLIDRLWRGAIIDFIDVGFWPIFNLADVSIVVGLTTAFWFLI